MNIIICGVKGTGKTSLSKAIETNYSFSYINDYEICLSKINEQKIINFVNNNNNYVIDLNYSLTPKNCAKLKNNIVYYLGFVTINEQLLFNLMNSKNENVSLSFVKKTIKKCKKFQKQCNKYNITFVDVNKDRNLIINEILNEIKNKI